MSKVTEKVENTKSSYRIKNWSTYNASLKHRGRITLYMTQEAIESWHGQKTGKRGGQYVYSDVAIETVLLLKSVYQLAYRQTQGLVEDLFVRLGLQLEVPSYTQVCRRAKTVEVPLYQIPSKRGMDLVIDSTGIKVYGEGEWKVRKHGYGKRRIWLKLHLGIDANTGFVHCMRLTGNDKTDGSQLPELLKQVKEPVSRVMLDGAYDTKECWDSILEMGAQPIIPPRENARIWYENIPGDLEHYPRNVALREIQTLGRAEWKKKIGYHRRSLSETAMYRVKTIFGERMISRTSERQQTEIKIKIKALNIMTAKGMPISEKIA